MYKRPDKQFNTVSFWTDDITMRFRVIFIATCEFILIGYLVRTSDKVTFIVVC